MSSFITSVTSYNRYNYLKQFVETWFSFKSKNNKLLIIADDGSSCSKVQNYLIKLSKLKEVLVARNSRVGVHKQTNKIFKISSNYKFNFAFKCDDDIFFKNKDWEDDYFSSANDSNFFHLSYYNEDWKKGGHIHEFKNLISKTNVDNSFGCFWTYNNDIINNIGFFDSTSFGFRGNGHIDFSKRCCRLGYNDSNYFYDIKNSNYYIDMHKKEGYINSTSKDIMIKVSEKKEQERRKNIINDISRIYIGYN
jgi:hypothetical protein